MRCWILVLAGVAMGAWGCETPQHIEVASSSALTTHFLPDYEYVVDSVRGFATSNHLLVFNPGAEAATLTVTVYFEDREPAAFTMSVPVESSAESHESQWPVSPNTRFAMMVESDKPVVAQATIGWTNTLNDYRPTARSRDGGTPRETALSYIAHRTLATHWLLADGIVIQSPTAFIRESEWAIVLNPGTDTAHVRVAAGLGGLRVLHHESIPPRRLRWIAMDSLVPHDTNYGAVLLSDRPVVANWRRIVQWADKRELMAFWSAPMVGMNSPVPSVTP
jgi:hypothetical protein